MSAKDLIFTVFGIDRASNTFDGVGKSMDRMASIGVKSMGGLAGASAAGAAAIAASLALVPVAFAGMGAAALRENAIVRQSFADLGETVRTGLAADAEPLADTFVGAANEIARAYRDLRPELRAGFVEAKPHVEALTRGVTGFAREAVPGMVTAVRKAGPVFAGLESFLLDTGRATGDFFEIVSKGAPGAGAFFEDMGNLAESVLPDLARLVVELTGLWAEHGDQSTRAIGELVGIVVDLGTNAMPIASSAMGVGLDILEGILAVVGPLADNLGPLVGIWLAMSVAMRTFGTVQGVIEGVTGTVANFRKEMGTAAGPQGMDRVRAAASGVLGLLGGPWGVALIAGAGLLAVFGSRSQEAAGDQRSLAAALKESAGAFDDNARQALVNSDQYKRIADSVGKAGLSHTELIDGLTKGDAAFEALRKRLEDIRQAGDNYTTSGGELVQNYTDQAAAAAFVNEHLYDLRKTVTGAEGDFNREKDAVRNATKAMTDAVPGGDALREAIKTLGKDTADTADKVDALNTVWRQLFGISISMEEANANFLEGLAGIRSHIDDTKKSVGDWQGALFNANGTINLTTEAGRALLDSLVEQGGAYRELAQTAFDTALKQGQSHEQATAAARTALEERRGQFITEMIQMGLNEAQARRLADTYFGFPDNVLTAIKLEGTREAEAALKELAKTRTAKIIANVETGHNLSPAALRGGAKMFNEGGLVPGDGPNRDSVPAFLTPEEFVVKRSAARRWLPLLEQINAEAGGDAVMAAFGAVQFGAGRGGGAMAGGIGAIAVQTGPERIVLEIRSGGSRMDDLIVEIIQRAVNNRGGDVLAVLGGRSR